MSNFPSGAITLSEVCIAYGDLAVPYPLKEFLSGKNYYGADGSVFTVPTTNVTLGQFRGYNVNSPFNLTWTKIANVRLQPNYTASINTIIWGGNRWVAGVIDSYNNYTTISSTDGLTWSGYSGAFNYIYFRGKCEGLAYNSANGYYVAVGYSGGGSEWYNTTSIYYSSNGTSWTSVPSSLDQPANTQTLRNQAYAVAWNGSIWLAVGYNSTKTISVVKSTSAYGSSSWTDASMNPFPGGAGRGIAWNGSIWVIVGKDASGNVCISVGSVDGNTWTPSTQNPFLGGEGLGIAWSAFGNYWIAVGYNSARTTCIAKGTADGMSWISVGTDASANPFFGGQGNSVSWNSSTVGGVVNPYWLAVGKNSGNTNRIAFSTDGLKWKVSPTTLFSGTSGNTLALAWNGAYWIAGGSDSAGNGIAAHSQNFVSPFYDGIPYGIGWNGSYWVAVGSTSDNTITFAQGSSDLTNWVSRANTVLTNPFFGGVAYGIAWGNSYWLALGTNSNATSNTCMAKSTDGIVWNGLGYTSQTNPFFGGAAYAAAWNSTGNYWVAVGSNAGGAVSAARGSSDGRTWTGSAAFPGGTNGGVGYGVAWNGSLWVAVGSNGTLVSQNIYSYKNGNPYAYYGNPGVNDITVARSSDGLNWIGTSLFIGGSGRGISWSTARNLWVAVGHPFSYSIDGAIIIATSPDASVWKIVDYDNGFYLKGIGYGVTYNATDNYFIGVGSNSTYPQYSIIKSDATGVNWNSIGTYINTTINAVAWNNTDNYFVAVGSNVNTVTNSFYLKISKPDPPTNLIIGGQGVGYASFSWTPPIMTGGVPITRYNLSSTPAGYTYSDNSTSSGNLYVSVQNTYSVTVTATNSFGTSLPSAPRTIRIGVPDIPTNVNATPQPNQVSLTWTAPILNGGATITQYYYKDTSGNNTGSVGATSTYISLTTLGTYAFVVSASNTYGLGDYSAQSGQVRVGLADPPSNITATQGLGNVTVSWTAPFQTGCKTINFYKVSSSPSPDASGTVYTQQTANGTASSAVVSIGKTGTYTFTVITNNTVGDSVPSSAFPVGGIRFGPPDPPTGITTVRGNGIVTVSWTAPSANGGAAITGYTVIPSSDISGSITSSGSTSSIVTVGKIGTYTFTVTATNSFGDGLPSVASSSVTFGPPTPPVIGTVTQGDGIVTVNFDANGVDNRGATVTGYIASSTPSSYTSSQVAASPATVSIAAAGTYTFSVVSVNKFGSGTPSSASSSVTFSVPIAPTISDATAGNGVIISFTPFISSGGASVTSYTATSSTGGFNATGSSSPLTIGNCTAGNYTFTLTASNKFGPSLPSAASSSVTVAAPINVSASISQRYDGFITLSLSATPRGAAISYIVTWQPTYSGTIDPPTNNSNGTGSVYIRNIANATTYYIYIIAGSTAGNSTQVPFNFLTYGVPYAPISSSYSYTKPLQVTFNWSQAYTGGVALESYQLSYSLDNANYSGLFTNPNGNPKSTTYSTSISSAYYGYNYFLRIYQNNGYVRGDFLTMYVFVGVAPVITKPSVTSKTGKSVSLSWSLSSYDSTVTGYTVSWSGGSTTTTGTTATATGLTPGTSYTFTVTTTGAINTSSESDPVTTYDVPGKPTSLNATSISAGTFTLNWTEPSSDMTITKYTLSNGSTSTTTSKSSLSAGTYTVTATSDAGDGKASASFTIGPPSEPSTYSASASGNTASVTWSDFAENNGGTVSYGITVASSGGLAGTVSFSGNSASITGLSYSKRYSFIIKGTTEMGSITVQTGGVTTGDPPLVGASAPPSLSGRGKLTVDGVYSILIEWGTPSNNGGSTITSYTVSLWKGSDSSGTSKGSKTSYGLSTEFTYETGSFYVECYANTSNGAAGNVSGATFNV